MLLASKNNTHVLLNLCFLDDKGEFGGKNRSLQLKEIFEENGYILTTIQKPKRPTFFSLLLWSLRYLLRFRLHRPICISAFREGGIRLHFFEQIFKAYPHITHYLQEGTGFGATISAPIVKSFEKKIIFTPANIEGMAPYDKAWTHTIPLHLRLKEEFYYFRKADAVFCISEEEAWLLRIAGVNAHFLPYIPPRKLLERILLRRSNRIPDTKFGFLYFANFYNAPNILGLKRLMNDIQTSKIKLPYPLKVAGLGANTMKKYAEGVSGVEFLGELSTEQLEKCLLTCLAVVLFHHPTSGMLTRVPEMILSGIPIIGNLDALKAYCLFPCNTLVDNPKINSEILKETVLLEKSKDFNAMFLKTFNDN
ncbi:MAG: hypothetical protein SNJ71_00765 [Bacteroidales bacterium]